MIHRSIRLSVLVSFALLAAPVAAVEPEDAVVPFLGGFLEETRIVYPLQVGEWKAVGEHLYDNQALGVSVRYATEGSPVRLDIYFYPVGKLDDDTVRQATEAERLGIATAREQSGDPVPDLGELQDLELTLPGEDDVAQPSADVTDVDPASIDPDILHGYSMDAALVVRGEHWDSAMVLFHDALHFIKGRISRPAAPGGRAQARAELEAFMSQLVPTLTIINTGQCGTWLPIETLPPGSEAPDGATSVTQGDNAAYVLADRILATDPESQEALVAQVLGMSMQGRLPPDCAGLEPINPDVPAGMREIRIEYRPQ